MGWYWCSSVLVIQKPWVFTTRRVLTAAVYYGHRKINSKLLTRVYWRKSPLHVAAWLFRGIAKACGCGNDGWSLAHWEKASTLDRQVVVERIHFKNPAVRPRCKPCRHYKIRRFHNKSLSLIPEACRPQAYARNRRRFQTSTSKAITFSP